MQSVSSRIWTRVAVSVSYDDNHYTTWTSRALQQLVKEKEYSEFKPVQVRLKIDLVSHPARAEGLINMTKYNFSAL